jgi:hypothetical protein
MPPKPIRIITGLGLLLALSVQCRIAAALDEGVVSTARALAQDGEQDFKEGRFSDASEKFLKAYYAVKVPTLARSAARALVQQGKLVRASELYRQALLLQPNELWIGSLQQDAQRKSKDELAELMPRLGRLKIEVKGAPLVEVEVSIDEIGVPTSLIGVNQYVDPGKRRVVAKRGTATIEKIVTIVESGRQEVVLELASQPVSPVLVMKSESKHPAAVSKSNTMRTLGWVGLGMGAAGLALGATTGILVAVKHSDVSADCPGSSCDPEKVSPGTTDSYNTMRSVSTIGFVVGVASAAVGVSLLLTTTRSSDNPSVSAWLGPSTAGLRGAF